MLGVRFIKNEAGFSLIELMIGIMILGLVFGVASSTLANMVHWSVDMEQNSDLQQEGKWALELMSRELRYADELAYPDVTTANLPNDFSYLKFTKTNDAGDSETITYGRGSDAGLGAALATSLGRHDDGGASPITNPQHATIANAADLNFHVSKSGNNSNSTEIIITLKLTGVTTGGAPRTAVFETTVYKLNGN